MEIYSVKLIYSSLSVNVKLLYPYNTHMNISLGFHLSFPRLIAFSLYFLGIAFFRLALPVISELSRPEDFTVFDVD
jgi:hypothetical protein